MAHITLGKHEAEAVVAALEKRFEGEPVSLQTALGLLGTWASGSSFKMKLIDGARAYLQEEGVLPKDSSAP